MDGSVHAGGSLALYVTAGINEHVKSFILIQVMDRIAVLLEQIICTPESLNANIHYLIVTFVLLFAPVWA